MQIQYLKHSEIDKGRWDRAISASLTPRMYALSWFLDTVSPGWEALTDEAYTVCMPLTVKRKWGLSYIVQPSYCQQLGVFSAQQLTEEECQRLFSAIPYGFVRMKINLSAVPEEAESCPNLILSLTPSYKEIASLYNDNIRKNLKRARRCGASVKQENDAALFIDLYRQINADYPASRIVMADRIIRNALRRKEAKIYFACNAEGAPTGAACFIKGGNRWVLLFSFTNREGKVSGANHAVINTCIQDHAASDLILDFEGSGVPSISFFMRGFRPTEEPYYSYSHVKGCGWRFAFSLISFVRRFFR